MLIFIVARYILPYIWGSDNCLKESLGESCNSVLEVVITKEELILRAFPSNQRATIKK